MSDFNWLIPDALSIPFPSASSEPVQIDHVVEGLNRLAQQWRDKQNIIDLLTIFLEHYNDLEETFMALLTLRNVYTANADAPSSTTGAQLDIIGKLVGQPRNGLNNDDYRRYIFARVATNNSNGTTEDLIKVALLVINDNLNATIEVDTQGVAAVEVRSRGVIIDNNLAGILVAFLRQARAAGVKLTSVTEFDQESNLMTLGLTVYSSDPYSAGVTEMTVLSDTGWPDPIVESFPTTGQLIIAVGEATQETVTYNFRGLEGGAIKFKFTAPTTQAHPDECPMSLVGAPGLGLGSSGDAGQPTLTPYANVGTTGGRLTDARD